MLVLDGCVQPAVAPSINLAAAQLLDRLGISLVRVKEGCCGALAHHLVDADRARAHMRQSIETWWPEIERGAEALVVTASGCGAMVRDYGPLLQDDPAYARKAARVTELARDISDVVAQELAKPDAKLGWAAPGDKAQRVAFHSPCTLQHGLRIRGVVEPLLAQAGFILTPVADSHICCGSAGSYSLLQPALSGRLKLEKLAALEAGAPDWIATANIGCLLHLASGTDRPVRHWIELLAARVSD
jgi:glycolate oxidase iron-sulfur subunit